ncbi:MAG: Plug domain-containing protein, partial [Myxococcota bacterium]
MFEGPKKAGAARLLSLAALIALLAPRAAAQAPAPPPDESDPAPADLTGENAEEVADLEDAGYGARAATAPELPSTQAASEVDRADLDRRVSTSAPDALRWEPGVAIQQTAHGQASPYVRGLTGQQVLHLFDGVRINHAIYRQGPNQYFFTVDARTLAGLEVERGSASEPHGTDALGGVIRATPL